MKNKIIKILCLSCFFLIFACRASSGNNVSRERGSTVLEKEKYKVYFLTSPVGEGNIIASVDGKSVKSGEEVEKDKEIVFCLSITNVAVYELIAWDGASQDEENPFIARKKVLSANTVIAKLGKKQEETEVSVNFFADPKNEGEVTATCQGKILKSGVDKVQKDSEVLFALKIKNPKEYEMDGWQGAEQDKGNPLIARVHLSQNTAVIAKLKKKNEDASLILKSLKIHEQELNISDLNNIQHQVEHTINSIKSSDAKATFIYGNLMMQPVEIAVTIDNENLKEGKNEVVLRIPALQGSYKEWMQKIVIVKKASSFVVTFAVEPKELGEITAIVDGVAIESGKEKIDFGKTVEFNLKIHNIENYELYLWQGAEQDKLNPCIATLEVKEEASVVAIVSKKKRHGEVTLDSLIVCNKKVDITDLENMRIEVDNIVDSIEYKDVIAMFIYKDDQEVPETLPFKVDKTKLLEGENIVCIEVEKVEESHKGWKKNLTIYRKQANTEAPISSNIRVSELGTFIVNESRKYEDKIVLENFNSQSAGPYRMQDAKTAYVAVTVKIEKPSTGNDDYEVYFENMNTYTPIYKAKRMEGEKADYFVSSGIVLSKGFNLLAITVKTPDKKDEAVYKIVTKYAGGPDQMDREVAKRRMLPGWYCPANRKPLDGELADYVWAIGIAGYCIYCPEPLNRAGKIGRLAEKYRSKGLRVIAIDTNEIAPNGSEFKWRDAGANYPLYGRVWNDFVPFYEKWPGYPRNLAIKDGRATMLYNGVETEIKQEFGF